MTAENILARLNDHIQDDATEIFKQEAIVNEIAIQQIQAEAIMLQQVNQLAV